MSRPRVSVVIPLYNHARYVEAAVSSVLSQTLPADEIVIVDDGSTDGSARVAASLAARCPQIRFWSKPNGGAHAAINDGVARSTGEFVAILNSDDLFHRERLERVLTVFDRHPAADAVCTGLDFIDGRGRPMANAWYENSVAFHRRSGDLGFSLVNSNFVMTTSNLVLRRRVLEAAGGFSGLRYAHDLDYLLRLVVQGRDLRRLDEPLISYRTHDSNTISEDHRKVKAEWAAVTAFYLSRLWDAGQPADWPRAGRFLELLDHHALTRPVLLCLAYFRRHQRETMENHPFFEDAAFRAELAGQVR